MLHINHHFSVCDGRQHFSSLRLPQVHCNTGKLKQPTPPLFLFPRYQPPKFRKTKQQILHLILPNLLKLHLKKKLKSYSVCIFKEYPKDFLLNNKLLQIISETSVTWFLPGGPVIFQLWEVVDILHIQQGSELTLTLCLTKGKYVKLKTMAYKN